MKSSGYRDGVGQMASDDGDNPSSLASEMRGEGAISPHAQSRAQLSLASGQWWRQNEGRGRTALSHYAGNAHTGRDTDT